MRIQILLSITIVIFGLLAVYLIHRMHSGSAQVALYGINDMPEAEGYDIPHIEDIQNPIHFPKLTSARPKKRDLPRNSPLYLTDMAERLGQFKYDGYIRIGSMKLAWLSDGKSRIAVKEGEVLDGIIRVDEIHENFLLVSDIEGYVSQQVPFTPSLSEAVSRLPSPNRTVPPPPPAMVPGNGNSETTIYIDPASKVVKSVGETFAVQVNIKNGSNIFAVPFDINYNPNILEVMGLQESSFLKKDGGLTAFLTSIDRDKGSITVGLTRLGRIGGVSGSGTLVSIVFRALRTGTARLSLGNVKLMDSELNLLPVKSVPGKVEVSDYSLPLKG